MGKKLLCVLLVLAGMLMIFLMVPRKEKVSSAGFFCPSTEPEATVQEGNGLPVQVLPCTFEGNTLVAEGLQPYTGLFLEDGSNDPVENVAALMVSNTGTRDISSAMVTVEQNGQKLHFFLTWLPANSKVLVLEYGRAVFSMEPVTACSVAGVRWETFENPKIQVAEIEHGQLSVINNSALTVPNIRLRYKFYVLDEEYYLGGITYCTDVGTLLSGEYRCVLPYWYAVGHTRVVAVLTG